MSLTPRWTTGPTLLMPVTPRRQATGGTESTNQPLVVNAPHRRPRDRTGQDTPLS